MFTMITVPLPKESRQPKLQDKDFHSPVSTLGPREFPKIGAGLQRDYLPLDSNSEPGKKAGNFVDCLSGVALP